MEGSEITPGALPLLNEKGGGEIEMLRRFRIEYQDESGDGPVFCDVWRGHDEEHAVERFLSAPDAEGWRVVSITPSHAEQPRRARKERR